MRRTARDGVADGAIGGLARRLKRRRSYRSSPRGNADADAAGQFWGRMRINGLMGSPLRQREYAGLSR